MNTANVDAAELEKFATLAHRWWDPASEFKPLHDINPLRLAWITQHTHLQGKKVVDVGCGGGILSESLALQGADVTGLDLGEKALSVARLHCLESGLNIDYRLCAAEDYAREAPASADVVTCMELLEHVPDPAALVCACATLLKPGGRVFFSTLNRTPRAYLLAVLAAEYLLHLLPRGTHDYARFITPAELAQFCRAASLEVDAVTGLHYQPLFKKVHLTTDTRVNYLLAAVRPA